jgi:hypothetical protein
LLEGPVGIENLVGDGAGLPPLVGMLEEFAEADAVVGAVGRPDDETRTLGQRVRRLRQAGQPPAKQAEREAGRDRRKFQERRKDGLI